MENTKERIFVNLTKEFIVYVSRNKKSWKKIDELYYKRYNECIDSEDDIKERIKEYGINLKIESIEVTCYINKLIALILLDEHYNSTNNIMSLISSSFSKSYKYAMSNPVVKLSSFQKRKININDSMDDIFSECLCLMLVAKLNDKQVDENDFVYKRMMECLYRVNNVDNGLIKTSFSYEKCSKTRKIVINELELILRGRYFSCGYNAEGLHEFLEVKECFGDANDRNLHTSKTKNDIYCKMYCSIEYTDNVLNKTNAGALFKDIEIKKDTIKDFINTYLIMSGYLLEDNIKINKNDINIEELSTFVAISLVQALYIEAYGNAYKFFFENYNENINVKYKEVLNENRDTKKNNLKIQDENEKLKLENEELKRRINKLEKELEKSKANNKELFELRSYIFNHQEEKTDIEEEYINLEYLKDKKIICFGGNKTWISNMGKEFDNWIFVPANIMNFDTSILKDMDIVFIKATHISHAMYYKIIANLNDETEIKFINNNNINRIKKELDKL